MTFCVLDDTFVMTNFSRRTPLVNFGLFLIVDRKKVVRNGWWAKNCFQKENEILAHCQWGVG